MDEYLGAQVVHTNGNVGKLTSIHGTRATVLYSDGEKVYAFTPDLFRKYLSFLDPDLQNRILVDSLRGYEAFEFKGELYCRKPGEPWKNLNLFTISDSLQKTLSSEYKAHLSRLEKERILKELRALSVDELLKKANGISSQINESMRNGLPRPANCANEVEKEWAASAIPLYEVAFEKICQSDISEERKSELLATNLPALSARYRNINRADQSIHLFEAHYRSKLNVITSAFLTSVAGAYCDLSDLDDAVRYICAAIKSNANRYTEHIDKVFSRVLFLADEYGENSISEDIRNTINALKKRRETFQKRTGA